MPLPPFESALISGGDARLAQDAQGRNKYGCFSTPHPELLAFGSSTASTISETGYGAALRLYQRLDQGASHEEEAARIRDELLSLYGLNAEPGLEVILAASGTDLHGLAAQWLSADAPLFIIMPEAAETGSGIPQALQAHCREAAMVASRAPDGHLRTIAAVDADTEALAMRALARGQRVLLIVTDQSKTGLITPSLPCALVLKQRFPAMVTCLVDACQFRLSAATLRAYLDCGFMLALTGSKFVTGPAFSGALLVPPHACWPTAAYGKTINTGPLLRWEAALAELRAFQACSGSAIHAFLTDFTAAIQHRLAIDPAFELLPTRVMNRAPLTDAASWDTLPTIFPFLLRHPRSGLLSRDETAHLYESLKHEGYQLGQPVSCGSRGGAPISALRLCVDMRLIVDAVSGRGGDAVMNNALHVLDKAAQSITIVQALS